jgi:O-antigen ligase
MKLADIKQNIALFLILAVGVIGFAPILLPFRVMKVFVSQWCVMAAVALLFIRNPWVSLFLLWAVIRTATTCNEWSVSTLQIIFMYLIIQQILVQKLNRKLINTALNIICVITLLHALWMALQSIGVWIAIVPRNFQGVNATVYLKDTLFPIYIFDKTDKITQFVGFADNINIASCILALGLPAFFRHSFIWKPLRWLKIPVGWCLLIPVVLAGHFFCHSLSGVLPTVLILSIYPIIKYGKKGFYGVIAVLALFAVYFLKFENFANVASLSDRGVVWKLCITKIIPVHWIQGWGVGQSPFHWKIIMSETGYTDKWLHCHNEFIWLWLEMGIIGFGLVMAYVFGLFRKVVRIIKYDQALISTLGVLAGLGCCMGIFVIHSTVGIMILAYMAMLENLTKEA